MSIDEFTDWVCIAIGDFSQAMKDRIQSVLPSSVAAVMYAGQWECMTQIKSISVTSGDYTVFPSTIFKAWALYRSGLSEEIAYIEPHEYIAKLAASATPLGGEVRAYTVIGSGTLTQKRFYWLNKPTGSHTVLGVCSITINTSAIQNIPDHFYETIRAHVIMSITPRLLEGQEGQRIANPNYPVVYGDFKRASGILKTIEGGRKGRSVNSELDQVAKNATQYMHP